MIPLSGNVKHQGGRTGKGKPGAAGKPKFGTKVIPGVAKVSSHDSRNRPNKGGSGSAKRESVPKPYKFKWPSISSSYDSIGADTQFGGAQGGGQLGINFPDEQVKVSGRKGVKRIY